MEDKRINSAFEIAMERVAKMPKLSPEEIMEQKERKYKPRGEAVANKYLENSTRAKDLEIELSKYQGKEREIVRKAFLSTLCQSIELEDAERNQRAIEGIENLQPARGLSEIKIEIDKICNEFHQQRQQRYSMFEELEREKLRELSISGSAIKPNLEENEDWQHELKQIQLVYEPKIRQLRKNLSHSIEV